MAWDRFLSGLLSSRSAQELERAEAEKRRWQRQFTARRRGARDAHALGERVTLLEDDVARLSLMAMTLTEVVVRAGLLTREQVRAVADEIDALDGRSDGKLHPDALRPEAGDDAARAGAPAAAAPSAKRRPHA